MVTDLCSHISYYLFQGSNLLFRAFQSLIQRVLFSIWYITKLLLARSSLGRLPFGCRTFCMQGSSYCKQIVAPVMLPVWYTSYRRRTLKFCPCLANTRDRRRKLSIAAMEICCCWVVQAYTFISFSFLNRVFSDSFKCSRSRILTSYAYWLGVCCGEDGGESMTTVSGRNASYSKYKGPTMPSSVVAWLQLGQRLLAADPSHMLMLYRVWASIDWKAGLES